MFGHADYTVTPMLYTTRVLAQEDTESQLLCVDLWESVGTHPAMTTALARFMAVFKRLTELHTN